MLSLPRGELKMQRRKPTKKYRITLERQDKTDYPREIEIPEEILPPPNEYFRPRRVYLQITNLDNKSESHLRLDLTRDGRIPLSSTFARRAIRGTKRIRIKVQSIEYA